MERRLIDWHSHIWEPEHLGDEWGPELDAKAPGQPTAHGRPDDHRKAMDEAGIEIAVVLALTSRHLGMSVPDDYIAAYLDAMPGRVVGFASVDPNDPNAVGDLRRAARDLGLRGLKLSPPYQAFHPHSEEAWAVYKAAADLGLVVMFHQGAVFTRRGVLEYASPTLLDKLAREFPDLRIIVAHMGQPWFFETVPLLYKHPNVYADLSASFSRPWQLYNILMFALDYGVEEKLLFGSDFPTFGPAQCIEQFRGINERVGGAGVPISEKVIDAILYERPLELLGLSV